MKPFLIIKCGSTFTETTPQSGDFEDWTRQGMGLAPAEVLTVPVCDDATLPDPASVRAAVITGSHAMVTDRTTWIEETAHWLRTAVSADLPVLGICFGHQLLAEALGGRAGWNPNGREIGTVTVALTPAGRKDPLLGGLPPCFQAHVTHSQSAVALPPDAVLLARSARDPVQAMRCGSAWGVQFHPEFSVDALRYYVKRLQSDLESEGLDPAGLFAGIAPTPEAATLLSRFVRLVRKRS